MRIDATRVATYAPLQRLTRPTKDCARLLSVGGLCSKEPEDEPLPPMIVDSKCVTGAQVSADGVRVSGEPSGIFLGVAMSVVFGNDKAYFEVRVAKCGNGETSGLGGTSGVLVGLGAATAKVETFQKDKMQGEQVKKSSWTVSAQELGVEDGGVIGVAYDGQSFPATVAFYTADSGDE